MTIEFTQFLRPHGKRKQVFIDIDEHYDALANKIIANGYDFEIEELMTGAISMTISDDEKDLVIRICSNGPEVVESI